MSNNTHPDTPHPDVDAELVERVAAEASFIAACDSADRDKFPGSPKMRAHYWDVIDTAKRLVEISRTLLERVPAQEAPPREDVWQPIESAPKDGTEFLSYGGPDNVAGKVQPTRWLSPGPYTTENGKNTEGERRYQWPDGFYWAGYDGFVGPVRPTHWRPLPEPPATTTTKDRT